MKCRYSYCKHGGEVNKDIAVKDGNSYYHKECLNEKLLKVEIENYYIQNMPSVALQLLRKAIKQIIHDKNISAELVLFALHYIKDNNKPLNSPFGLTYYCEDNKIQDLYKKEMIKKQYKKININNNFDIAEENIVKFTYKKPKKITDLI